MDANEEQNNAAAAAAAAAANGAAQTGGNSRTAQIAHMSLYERQAVQALQALQRQPNAAQYFQQLMLQQQISSAQLQNLAAVQQATLAASRQSNAPSNSGSQTATTVNLSTTSAGGAAPRPHGPPTSATTTAALNQSVLIGSNSAGQGQMYLRVNRSLRAPLASQFIFMPGGTATATVATVAQAQQTHDAALANGAVQSDNDQVQNLALHHASSPRTLAVKSELPERKDAFGQQPQPFGQTRQQQVQPQPAKPFSQQPGASAKSGTAAAMTVSPAVSVATTSSALPLSQLLLSSTSTPVILVPTSSVSTSSQGYPIASVTPKPNMTAQTLVVQPLQQDKSPVPIQPKTAQGHRLPVQLPPRLPTPILPAPPSGAASSGCQGAPHVPVQLVGARQSAGGAAQALAHVRSNAAHEQAAAAAGGVANNTPANVTKPLAGSLKRKSDCDVPGDIITSEPLESMATKDSAPPLSPAPKDLAPPAAFSSPPTLSLPPPLSRVGLCDKERPPLPQAVVKPQVLTHLIEGFVIQEGAEPFPVAGLLKDRDFSLMALSENGPALLKCEYCGNLAPANQFRGSKRFCTNTCAKRYNVSCSQHFRISRSRSGSGLTPDGPRRKGTPRRSISDSRSNKVPNRHLAIKCHSESSHSEEASSDGEDDASLSPTSSRSGSRAEAPRSDCSAPGAAPLDGGGFLSSTPAQWSVDEVFRFISSLQGCEELAAQFLSQEIDGQALLLLREDHLIATMNIKLGPALKICASINGLRE
ncbi:polyhomeotic-like protein 1 [Eucyclogobius newberryi]|uniref:polyhomeotic-like protein 1 n=1 Tax=Eucyclogobius newberryi TaxID=166745 RepID=UPI003B59DCED